MFYSGLAYEKDKEEAFNAGAQRYLVKPVNIPLLVETLGNLLAESKRTAAKVRRIPEARKDSENVQPLNSAVRKDVRGRLPPSAP